MAPPTVRPSRRAPKTATTTAAKFDRSTGRPSTGARAPKAQAGDRASGASPLGTYANNSSTPRHDRDRRIRHQDARAERWALRSKARKISTLERVRKCGRVPITGEGGPTVRVSTDSTGAPSLGFAGLASCGSVWACCQCAAKVAAVRAEEVATVMRWALDRGGSAALVTLTMRHHAGHRLAACFDAAAYAWSKVTSGRGWYRDQARAGGIHGWIRVMEVTRSERNGWHVHFHVLVLFRGDVDLTTAQDVGNGMFVRWAAALSRRGFESWRELGGLDVRLASLDSGNLADYFTKMAREVTASYAKRGRKGSRSPFAILADAVDTYAADDLELWWEWEQASRGRRHLTWSQGLRAKVIRDPEEGDEAVAAKDDLQGDSAVFLPAETWRALVDTPAQTDLLDVGEDQADAVAAVVAVCAFLDRRGLPYRLVRNVAADDQREREWRAAWRDGRNRGEGTGPTSPALAALRPAGS